MLRSLVRKFDIASQPYALNSRGSERFTTTVGGVCGLLLYAVIAVFTYFRLLKLVTRDDPQLFEVTQGMHPVLDAQSHNLKLMGVEIGIGIYRTDYYYNHEWTKGENWYLSERTPIDPNLLFKKVDFWSITGINQGI